MTAKPQDVSLNVVGQSIVSTMNLGATKADINALKLAAISSPDFEAFSKAVKNNLAWKKLDATYKIPYEQTVKFFNRYSLQDVVDDRGFNALRSVDVETGKQNIFIAGAGFPGEFLAGGVSRTGLYGGDVVQAKAAVDAFNRWGSEGVDMSGAIANTNSLGGGVLALAIPNLKIKLGGVIAFGAYGTNTWALDKPNS